MKRSLIKTAILCLIAGLSLSGCKKEDISVTGISLNATSKNLTVGETFELTATVAPNSATNKTLEWTSSNPAVASVSNGTVTAIAIGEAVITVKTVDVGKTATCNVAVVTPVSGVNLSATDTILTIGETFVLTATVVPDNATDKTLEWTSSNTTVASVSDGTVTALAVGEAVITVKTVDGNKTASCNVSIEHPKITMITGASPVFVGLSGYGTAIVNFGDEYSETHTLTCTGCWMSTIYTYTDLFEYHTITVSGTKIVGLRCFSSGLTTLDISKNTALTDISCTNNQLSTLDVSKNTALTDISCSRNQLSVLDVSKNTALTSLDCYNNQLSALDVSKNTALTSLYCNDNQLTALDVSKNTALRKLSCYNNQLSADALNTLFSSLHSNTIQGSSKEIGIRNNPGTNSCDRSIATNKGWTVTDY
jgi:Leucine-rich repeat (LRR) protein